MDNFNTRTFKHMLTPKMYFFLLLKKEVHLWCQHVIESSRVEVVRVQLPSAALSPVAVVPPSLRSHPGVTKSIAATVPTKPHR